MAASESLRLKSSGRKSWIKQLSERYSERIDEVVDEDCVSVENENLASKDVSGSSVSTEHTDDSSTKTSTDEYDAWSGHKEYRVEVMGDADPPAEWQDLNGRKQSAAFDSISSGDIDNAVERDLEGNDTWRLTERDNEALEVDMRKETGELNDASLASDEESLMRTPVGDRREKTTTNSRAKRISSPTTFPSNFTSVRTGKATEMFTERMKSIEQKNKAKTKSKMAPVVATIGRFSSAFRRFEGKEERSHSLDGSMPGIKVQHSAVSASASISVSKETKHNQPKVEEPKKLPRIPFDQSFSEHSIRKLQTTNDKKEEKRTPTSPPPSQEQRSPTRLVRTPVDSRLLSGAALPVGRSSRTPTIPVVSSRLMRNVRDSGNAPDVVAATLQPDREGQSSDADQQSPRPLSVPTSPVETEPNAGQLARETEDSVELEDSMRTNLSLPGAQADAAMMNGQMRHPKEQMNPHFDIDIVIKRDPLPDTMSPEDFSREPPTTAITLGRDEVTVMKIDSHNQGSSVNPSEVITVWDTEVPVRESHERVIPPTKLHVSHLNKGIPLRLNSPASPDREQTTSSHSFAYQTKASPTDGIIERKERQHRHQSATHIQTEPVMVKIRPQPVQQWPDTSRDFRRSKSQENEFNSKQRSSIALEPEDLLKSTASERSKQRIQLTSSERAIPKRRPVTYNTLLDEPQDMSVHQHQQPHYSQHQQHPKQSHQSQRRQSPPPRQAHNPPPQASFNSRPNERPLLYSQEQPIHQSKGHQQQQELSYSHQHSRQHVPRDVTPQQYKGYDGHEAMHLASEKMKSNSLDDLRMLREGLVANTKAVFSSTREPGKQYFGEHISMTAPKRPPMPAEDADYTREWVENSKHPNVSRSKNERVPSPARQSPAREEKKDRSWFLERQPNSPPRGVGGAHRRRTRSLGRVTTKSKAIVQMAKFFQDEAEMGATHRDVSPSEDDIHSTSAFDRVMPSAASLTATSRASMDDLHSPKSAGHWRSNNARPSTTKSLPRFKGDKPQNRHEFQDERKSVHRPSSKNGASGTGEFIGIYNEKEVESRHTSEMRGPRKSLIVREERMSQNKVKQTASRSKSMDAPAVQVNDEPAEEHIDDRPLAASAFKAWLGSDNQLQTPLEQTVEQAYQTHMRIDKGQKVISDKEQRHKAVTRMSKPKADPWWKQQNEMASQRRTVEVPAREEKKPVVESFISTEHGQQQHQLRVTRANDPPYANYQAQMAGYKPMEADRKDQVEDYYAQIRKKPVADRTHSLPNEGSEEGQLFVHVAPPKPERSSAYLSNNSLDNIVDQQAPDLPHRHEMIEEMRVEQLHAPTDNRMYYDPYTTIEQPQHQPTQQYNPQPRPSSVDPYERSYARGDNYATADNFHYPADEMITAHVEHHEVPNPPRENRLYHRQEPISQPYNTWEQRGQPYSGWQGAQANQPPVNAYQWSSRDPQPDWRTGGDYRRQPEPRPHEQRHTQPVREWQTARQDPRYNTWSDRGEHNRSRPVLAELRPHNTLPHPEARSQSYRIANPSTRSLEKQRIGDPRPDVLPADRSMDRRPRRARSVPITRPLQQKSNKSGETKASKSRSSSKHDQKPARQDKSEERPSKSSKSKTTKSRSQKESAPKHQPPMVMPADSSPLPDFIPSHYFNERAYGAPDRSNFIPQGPQYIPSQPDYPSQPQMAYNQQTYSQQPTTRTPYNQPTNQMPYNQPTANQISYNQQPTNQMPYNNQQSYNQQPPNQAPYSRQPPNHGIPNQQPSNDSGYTKHTAYTTYADRPRPGVGVMFNPLVGATDF